jgi:hypothetical protein
MAGFGSAHTHRAPSIILLPCGSSAHSIALRGVAASPLFPQFVRSENEFALPEVKAVYEKLARLDSERQEIVT